MTNKTAHSDDITLQWILDSVTFSLCHSWTPDKTRSAERKGFYMAQRLSLTKLVHRFSTVCRPLLSATGVTIPHGWLGHTDGKPTGRVQQQHLVQMSTRPPPPSLPSPPMDVVCLTIGTIKLLSTWLHKRYSSTQTVLEWGGCISARCFVVWVGWVSPPCRRQHFLWVCSAAGGWHSLLDCWEDAVIKITSCFLWY